MTHLMSLSRWHKPSKLSIDEGAREWDIYKYGYYVVEVPRDGNCAFHTIGLGVAINNPNDQIHHTHHTLRQGVVEKMQEILDDPDSDGESGNMLRQTIQFCGEDFQEKKCTTKTYFEFMKTDSFFADDAVLSTYAMLNSDTVNLVRWCEIKDRYSGKIDIRPQTLCEYSDNVDQNIYLLWENDLTRQQHYNLIVPVTWGDYQND